jgi:hypothetical protein
MADTPIITVEYLLDLITAEHAPRPRYMATVSLSVRPFTDGQTTALSYQQLFDLDTAVGEQLDFVGQWVGITRYIVEPIDIFFEFDRAAVGLDYGKWKTAYEEAAQIVRLDDDHYRILLRARIVANYWDGTIPGAYKAWDTLFKDTGYQVLIQDGFQRAGREFQFDDVLQGLAGFDAAPWYIEPELARIYLNLDHPDPGLGFDKGLWFGPHWAEYKLVPEVHGTMEIIQALLGPPLDAVIQALFSGGYMGLDSAGVGTLHIIQNQDEGVDSGIGLPLFGLDAGPTVEYWCSFDIEGLGHDEAPIWYPGAIPIAEDLPHFMFDQPPLPSIQDPLSIGLDQGYWSTKEYPVEEPDYYLNLDSAVADHGLDVSNWYGAGAIPPEGENGVWLPPPPDPDQPLPPTGIEYPEYLLAGFDLGAWAKQIEPAWRRGQIAGQ